MRFSLPVITCDLLERVSTDRLSAIEARPLAEQNNFELMLATVRQFVRDRASNQLSILSPRLVRARVERARRSHPAIISATSFDLDQTVEWSTWVIEKIVSEGTIIAIDQHFDTVLVDAAGIPFLLRASPGFMIVTRSGELEIVDISLNTKSRLWLHHWCSAAAGASISRFHSCSSEGIYSTVLYPKPRDYEPFAFAAQDFVQQYRRVQELASLCRAESLELAIRNVESACRPAADSILAWTSIPVSQEVRPARAS